MKRILSRVALVFAVFGMGCCVFVWWKLHPWPNPQPLPAVLTGQDSAEGNALLEGADAIVDYQPLVRAFEPQVLVSYCGVASGVTVLNAMGNELTQLTFFDEATDEVRSRFEVMFGGMSLPELAGLLRAHGVEVQMHHAASSSPEAFRSTIDRNLQSPGDFVLVNYQRGVLGQGRGGHISPLAAYDRDTDQVLILDTAGHKYPPTWVAVDLLFSAMSTVDASTEKTRGFLEVAKP